MPLQSAVSGHQPFRLRAIHLGWLIAGLLLLEIPILGSMFGDDLRAWKQRYLDAPDPVMVLLERRATPPALPSDPEAQPSPKSRSTSTAPSQPLAGTSSVLHRADESRPPPSPTDYHLLGFSADHPRFVTFDVQGTRCAYGLGDHLPGWGPIIVLTDRSVTVLTESRPYFDRRLQFPSPAIMAPPDGPRSDACPQTAKRP